MAEGTGCGGMTNSLIWIYDQLSFIYRHELVMVVMDVDKRAMDVDKRVITVDKRAG